MNRLLAFSLLSVCFGLMVGGLRWVRQPPPQQLPANAAGNWTLYCKDPNGSTSTKYLDLKQKGTVIIRALQGAEPIGWGGGHDRYTAPCGSHEDARCAGVSRASRWAAC